MAESAGSGGIKVPFQIVGLDESKASIRSLYAEIAKMPTPNAPGGGGPGVGTIAGGVALGQAAYRAGAGLLNMTPARSLFDTFRDELLYSAFGPGIGTATGALSSRGAVASQFGKLKAMGLVSDDFLRNRFDFEDKYGAGAQARGEAQIRGALGDKAGADIMKGIGQGIENLIVKFIPTLASAIGDAVSNAIKNIL